MIPASPRALLLDLDGTIVDTAADLRAALARLLAEAGLAAPSLAMVRAMIGDGAAVLVERAFAAAGQALAADELRRRHARFLEHLEREPCRFARAYDGVPETLTALRAAGTRLGLCTNKPQRATELLLRGLGLEPLFDCVLGGDVLAVRKPDPGHPLAVLAALDAAPGEAVLVGDSGNDLRAARAAGLRCVLVSWGYGTVPAREQGADAVIDSFAELPAALAALDRPRHPA